MCKETTSSPTEMQPALQWKYLITDVSNASQRCLNAEEESNFFISNEQMQGKRKFLSCNFSMLPIYLQNDCSHKNTGFLYGYRWSGQAVGFISLSQHNLSSSRVFPDTKAPEYLFQTKLVWLVSTWLLKKLQMPASVLHSLFICQLDPSSRLLRFDTIIARSVVIQDCNNIIVTSNHHYTYFNFNKLL